MIAPQAPTEGFSSVRLGRLVLLSSIPLTPIFTEFVDSISVLSPKLLDETFIHDDGTGNTNLQHRNISLARTIAEKK